MHEGNLAQTALARILKDSHEHQTLLTRDNDMTTDNYDEREKNSSLLPSIKGGEKTIHSRRNQTVKLRQEALQDSSLVGAGGSTDSEKSNDEILCYLCPFVACGRGERGRYNIKTIFGFVLVPIFFLNFFLLDDIGRFLIKNTLQSKNNVKFLANMSGDSVTDFTFSRYLLNVYKQAKREVLVRYPEISLKIQGVDLAATMRCPRGILFLFHGCTRYAASFFYSPQGRQIISKANDAGFITVAFTKKEELGCWNSEYDLEAVRKVARKLLKSRIEDTCIGVDGAHYFPPIYGFGASSGGSFVEELASMMHTDAKLFSPFLFSAINIQLTGPTPGRLWDTPTLFTLMNGDEYTKQTVESAIPLLQRSGAVGPFKVLTTSGKKQFTKDHFAMIFNDDPQMTLQVSAQIYDDMLANEIIDTFGYVKIDPRSRESRMSYKLNGVLKRHHPKHREKNRRRRHETGDPILPYGINKRLIGRLKEAEIENANRIWLIEEINVAWDVHEITAEGFGEVISFFLEHSSVKPELVKGSTATNQSVAIDDDNVST